MHACMAVCLHHITQSYRSLRWTSRRYPTDMHQACRRPGRRKPTIVVSLVVFALIGMLTYVMLRRAADQDSNIDDDEVPYGGSRRTDEGIRRSFTKICSLFNKTAGMYLDVELDAFRLRGQSSTATSAMHAPATHNATFPFTKIIHRMWKTAIVPEKWTPGVSTCRQANPDWLYCHWTDDELSSFVSAEFPDFRSTYDAYPYNIQRADASRYLLLYHYSGVYLDLDVKCKLSFDDIFSDVGNTEPSLSLAASDVILAEAEPLGVVSDFIAVRRRRDALMRHVIAGLRQSAETWYPLPYVAVMFGTGPVYLSRRARDFNEKTASRGSSSSVETSRVGVIPKRLYNGVYFGHMEGATWHSWDGHIIWTVFRLRYQLLKLVLFVLLCVLSITGLLVFIRWKRRCRSRRPQRLVKSTPFNRRSHYN